MDPIFAFSRGYVKPNSHSFNIRKYTLTIIGILVILVNSCKKPGENEPGENEPGVSSLTDIEGNKYETAKIGTQWWMAENLKTTKFNDGTDISQLGSNNDFGYYITPAYCWYDNNSGYKSTYGAIYNWYAVSTGMLCPAGWHVPSESEWSVLFSYLGGESVAGAKLKDTSKLWQFHNVGATNESGFSGLPGGARWYTDPAYYRGVGFNSAGVASGWWSHSENSPLVKYYFLYGDYEFVKTFSGSKGDGIYVRCIKDSSYTKTPDLPVLNTKAAISIAGTTATSGGSITNDGGATIISRGVCWSTTSNPTVELSTKTNDGTGLGSFSGHITGLTLDTRYFVRAYATNKAGTGYGNQISFTTGTGQTGTITDIEGNVYSTISTGSQIWMAENLKTTKFSDGTEIPVVTDNTIWGGLSTPAYCWYNNDPGSNKAAYGALYNWYAVSTFDNGGKNICPTGWHIPGDDEWSVLTTFWGGEYAAGGKLKESGTTHWASPNAGATNESSFTALPGGFRNSVGFQSTGLGGCWWSSSTFLNTTNYVRGALARFLGNSYSYVYRDKFGVSMKFGYSVRCLKDN